MQNIRFPVRAGKDPPKPLYAPMSSLRDNFFQDFCFKMEYVGDYPFGGAVPGKGRGSCFFKHIEETSPHPQAGLQTSSAFTFGKGGREECLQATVFGAYAFLAAGRCQLSSDCGLGSTVQVWRMPFFLAKFIIWNLADAAAVIADFIAARSKWMSRRKSRRNRMCH